ncbi:hypothetical protein [Candidatus Pseudomonas adelgestsugas]|uniref:Uncharacterized protein n=1 Tax=Candidatus Pseudomonas adelgestsugas TaxID=1302376 RepID=A0ABX5R8S9_9PSED|nr:hypothetical protein [Candidatus Pseudomonas adelgestsugas]QAX82045.1 hypothetical protein C3B55_00724 [Candidatus Pseudomonas adelgestsugas]
MNPDLNHVWIRANFALYHKPWRIEDINFSRSLYYINMVKIKEQREDKLSCSKLCGSKLSREKIETGTERYQVYPAMPA